MEPKAKMPDIKSEVNKVDDGKKKATGLLGGLFGGGGSGAAGGLGGLGAGAAGTGGLLATKAGMLALVLMGSAVAGGIGLAGYKMFGPGDADKAGGNLSLFAPRPQQADPSGVAAVNADGSSASLDMMAQSAAKDKAADAAANAPADAAPAGGAASDPARDAAAADAAKRAADAKSGGAINSGGGAGAVGSMGHLGNVKKLGTLSAPGGGGSSSSAGSAGGRLGDNLANAAKNGASSAFAKSGPGAKSSSSSNRGVAGRTRSAGSDMKRVLGDQAKGKANSTYAAGKTYDGSAAQNGGTIGPDGSAIGMDGVGDSNGAKNKNMTANAIHSDKEFKPPVPKVKESVSPWSNAISRAMMLTMAALALVYAAGKIPPGPYTQILLWAIGIAIIAIGAYIAILAGQISGGKHAQGQLASVVAACAIGVGIAGVRVCMAGANSAKTEDSTEAKPQMSNELGADGAMLGSGMILIGGGMAAIAAIGLMVMPKADPVELEPGEDKPDVRYEQRVNPTRYTV